MAKWMLIFLVILLLAAPTACSSAAKTKTAASVSTNATASTTPRPSQNVTSASPTTPVLHVRASGRLSFVQDIKLTFGTSGTVAQVNVSAMDRVTKGQVLAMLDTTSLQESLTAAQLAENTAKFARDQANYSYLTAQTTANTTLQNVISANVDLQQAQDNLNKIIYPYNYQTVYVDVPTALGYITDAITEITSAINTLTTGQTGDIPSILKQALSNLTSSHDQLYRKGVGTDPFADQNLSSSQYWTLRTAEFALQKAQIAVQNAQNSANASAISVSTAKTALDNANNSVDIAHNNVIIAKDTLQKAIITAPFDGVVGAVNVKVFDVLSTAAFASTTAVEIIDPSRMELNVNINELDIANVKVGQKVNLTVDALPNLRIDGTVTFVGTLPSTDTSMMQFPVKITFTLPQNSGLKSGMNARADIIAG